MLDNDLHRQVEEACLNAWPAMKAVFYDGWLIRFAEGQTRRSNSVNVIRRNADATETKIAYCETLYQRHSQPACFRILPDRDGTLDEVLTQRGYRREGETATLFMNFTDTPIAGPDRRIDLHENGAGEEWLCAQARLSGLTRAEACLRRSILALVAVPTAFAASREGDGAIVSVAFGAVHAGTICLQWVVTDPTHRRSGHCRATLLALLTWAQKNGASGACLQVVADNRPAVNLYRSIGFRQELYRYHYRVR